MGDTELLDEKVKEFAVLETTYDLYHRHFLQIQGDIISLAWERVDCDIGCLKSIDQEKCFCRDDFETTFDIGYTSFQNSLVKSFDLFRKISRIRVFFENISTKISGLAQIRMDILWRVFRDHLWQRILFDRWDSLAESSIDLEVTESGASFEGCLKVLFCDSIAELSS